jgi:hypothetical protein
VRLIGAVLLEANDDWQLQHRYMQIEGMAELNTGLSDDHLLEATTTSRMTHGHLNHTRISTTLTHVIRRPVRSTASASGTGLCTG